MLSSAKAKANTLGWIHIAAMDTVIACIGWTNTERYMASSRYLRLDTLTFELFHEIYPLRRSYSP